MKSLCIVPCGKKKIWDIDPETGPTAAKDVYIGPFAKKCKEYATKFYSNSWCTLSAKFGFLMPDDLVPGPYNVSFNDSKGNPVSSDTLKSQVSEEDLDSFDEFIILGGKAYVSICVALFHNERILTPLRGCKGIGYMMGRLHKAIEKGVPL